MGRAYAKNAGELDAVADAVRDHYRPAFATDGVAPGDIAAVVALADRLDTLAGCFAVGLEPTGAADPYGLRRAYAVVVPAATIAGKRDKRLAAVARDMKLPGFRPGKIPPNIVRQRFGGAVMAEVLEQSVQDATQQVLSDRGLRSAGQPKVEVTGMLDPRSDAASDLSFTVELELLPEITPPELSDIELTRLVAVPSEATIDKALGEIAARQRTLTPIEEPRPAVAGDVLTVDFLGRVDGVAFEGGTGTDMDVEIGGSGFIPGFSEGMVGMIAAR